MVVTKKQKFGKHYFLHTYSDENFRIRQVETGVVYDEAWDLLSAEYTYEETDEKIEVFRLWLPYKFLLRYSWLI